MRYLRCTVMWFILLAASPLPLLATSSSTNKMCKKIHDAIRAGHTIDQIIVEFDTDAETVVKCTQKRGKRKAAPKQKKPAKSGSTSSNTTTPSSTEQAKSSGSASRKPSAPRSGPLPAYLP